MREGEVGEGEVGSLHEGGNEERLHLLFLLLLALLTFQRRQQRKKKKKLRRVPLFVGFLYSFFSARRRTFFFWAAFFHKNTSSDLYDASNEMRRVRSFYTLFLKSGLKPVETALIDEYMNMNQFFLIFFFF